MQGGSCRSSSSPLLVVMGTCAVVGGRANSGILIGVLKSFILSSGDFEGEM